MNGGFIAFVNERDAPSIVEQPRVTVQSWRLLKASSGHVHLSIFMGGITLRITSPVVTVVLPEAIAVTSSGRVYVLSCPPEADDTLLGLLLANAQRVGFSEDGDVSEELWSQVETARLGIPPSELVN